MNKAEITLYDDLVIIDETEVFFTDEKNLASIAINCLRTTPNAEVAEVYVNGRLKTKYTLTNKGKPKKISTHPNWGGARPNSGPKRSGERLDHLVHFRVSEETYNFLNKMDSFAKTEWLRAAIQEKREREEEKG